LQTKTKTEAQLHQLTEGSYLFCCPQGNILLGCPPEILKRILATHLPMPDTVVVPQVLHHQSSSQASLEFPLYHFLFVQRGLERNRQFRVIATQPQCRGLSELLRITVVGPDAAEMEKSGQDAGLSKELYQETLFMALKDSKTRQAFPIEHMVQFTPLENGKHCEVYPNRQKLPACRVERLGDAKFRVLYGEDAFLVDLAIKAPQEPNYPIQHKPHHRAKGGFSLTVLGRSNGFDPKDGANGYLLDLNGKLVLWDCPAYLHLHLKALKIGMEDLDGMVLSHVHEDHIDVVESVAKKPLTVYTTPEIYYSMLMKLTAVFGCSLEEAKAMHRWVRIDTGKPIDIAGGQWTFFHAVHAIPALGVRLAFQAQGKSGLLHISGDHLSNSALATMLEAGGISKRRYEQMISLINGKEDLLLVDVGGGIIHGDYRDYLEYKGKGRIGFMHTGLVPSDLPANMKLVDSGEVWTIF